MHGRPVVVVANDATVKAGSWWPETITKMLRAQEVAMRCRIPIVYLVDSAGVNLPYQGGVFPGQYGASRLFYYNSIMRRYLRVPQLAAVMGPCIAGGAYLPALSDLIVMVKGTSFMGLGGPNLVKGATGQTIDAETLGGAVTHTEISGVAHYAAENDDDCLATLRELVSQLPSPATLVAARLESEDTGSDGLYDLLAHGCLPFFDPFLIVGACATRFERRIRSCGIVTVPHSPASATPSSSAPISSPLKSLRPEIASRVRTRTGRPMKRR